MEGNKISENPLLRWNDKNKIQIEFNWEWIFSSIPIYNFVKYDNINLSFDVSDLLFGLEMAKKHKTNDDDADLYEESSNDEFEEKFYVNKKLFDNVSVLISDDNHQFNKLHVGTLCWALIIIAQHFIDCEQILEDDEYEDKKSNCRKTISFLTFLEAYKKGDMQINKISISPETDKNVKGNFDFPEDWFALFYSSFYERIELNTAISSDDFISQRKKECEDFLLAFPRKKVQFNQVIRENVIGLDKLLNEKFGIDIPNKRNVIIGHLLSYIGKPYSVDDVYMRCRGRKDISVNEFVAGLARDYLKQAKK
jgi:hypothetical protein